MPSTLLRVGRDGSATPVTADRGDKQIGLSNFECAGARQGPFCFACQIRCLNAQCRSAVSLCARLDHCTHVRINAQRSFATLKTTDKAYLTSVAAAAAAQRTSSAATCALEGRSAATPNAEHAAERARGRAAGWPAYFVHIQNAGGTTMCRLARLNGVAAPEEAPEESGVFGRNCNPGSADAPRIWKGSAAAQAAYLRAGAYRFVANELALPPELAWGAARYVVVVRHPYAAQFWRNSGAILVQFWRNSPQFSETCSSTGTRSRSRASGARRCTRARLTTAASPPSSRAGPAAAAACRT